MSPTAALVGLGLAIEYHTFKLREIGLVYGVWGMEFNSKFGFYKQGDINKHVWYSIPSLVFNPNVGFESQVWHWQ